MNKSVNKEKKGLTKSKQSSPRQKEDVKRYHCLQESCRSKRHVAQIRWDLHINTKMHDPNEGDKKDKCIGLNCKYCKGKCELFRHVNFFVM